MSTIESATLGGGCFWCLEAIYQLVNGVKTIQSGYSGGDVENPSYKEVCSGLTGHAEVVHLEFDSEIISFDEILRIFFEIHDPTTLNKQGADEGTQYRSIILYHNTNQKDRAESIMAEVRESHRHSLVTELVEFEKFYPAESHHQNYFKRNPGNSYCFFVIRPKIEKFLTSKKEKKSEE